MLDKGGRPVASLIQVRFTVNAHPPTARALPLRMKGLRHVPLAALRQGYISFASMRKGHHALFGLDIGFANDAAVVDRLPAKISREISAAGPDWIETLDDKLLSDLGNLHRDDEPV